MIHELKIQPKYYDEIINGIKTFEVRKNDRNYAAGDYLALNCYDSEIKSYIGTSVIVKITYMLKDPQYCKKDYVILGIVLCKVKAWNDFARPEGNIEL